MSRKDTWRAEVWTRVLDDGTVDVLGTKYWSPDARKYAGWDVEVRLFDDAGPVQIWKGHKFLCAADILADAGFDYPDIPAEAVAELNRQADAGRALVVRGQAALLVELLTDTVEDAALSRAGVRQTLNRFCQFFIEFIPIVRDRAIKRDRHRDLERAKRLDARLRLAQSIFDLPYTIHGRKPSCEIDVDRAEGKQTEEAGHRLSGGGELDSRAVAATEGAPNGTSIRAPRPPRDGNGEVA